MTHTAHVASEPIFPPDPPDKHMVETMRETFLRMPRIVEAWVVGARLTPSDGSPSWDTTYVVLVLDPPIDRKDAATELSELQRELRTIGYQNEPTHNWVYAERNSFRPDREQGAELIYSRSGTA
jgi:hypothetical protein